jgi:predicted RNA-binding protein (virulence factor B family)
MATLGRLNTLRVTRHSMPGYYLDGGELGEVLLPRRETPSGTKLGDKLQVFVYFDADGRLLATLKKPLAMVGEVAALRVEGYMGGMGVFLDWGMEEQLLLPAREQEAPVRKGEFVVVYVYEDPKTHRILASSRLQEHLVGAPADYVAGQPVNLLIVRETPLGYTALVEGKHLGLLYRQEGRAPLKTGDKVQGYMGTLRTDGKLDLTLDSSGRHAVTSLAEQILEALQSSGGRLDLDDDSMPEDIRARFGASKKAFKQAVGALFRGRKIVLTKPGIELAPETRLDPRQR